MHHGTACVVGEAEWSGAFAHLRLERSCALLTWSRTAHRPHSQHGMVFWILANAKYDFDKLEADLLL